MASIDCPLVSIIIICYNDRKYIGEAIDSALAQTYPNCEVIVVDDGSMDGTREFVAERYGNLVQYCWKENGGQGSARSRGQQMASGKYSQNLDSDDLLLPDKVMNQVDYLEAHPDIAFVYGRVVHFWDDDPFGAFELKNYRTCSGNLLKEILINGNFINNGQPLVRRDWIDRIGGYDPLIRAADDYDFILRLAYAGAKGQFINEAGHLYRHPRNPSDPSQIPGRTSNLDQLKGEVYLFEKMYSIMQRDSYPDIDLARDMLGDVYFQLGRILFSQAYRRNGLQNMYKGLRFNRKRLSHKLVSLIPVRWTALFRPGKRL